MHPSFTGHVFDVWRRAREIFHQFFERHDTSIIRLATSGYVLRAKHRRMCDWLCHLEMLVRCLIVTAALAIKVTLAPRAPGRRTCKPRRVIIWDHKPSTWVRLHLRIFQRAAQVTRNARTGAKNPPRVVSARPLARRLETLRRILGAPEASARRAAFHLARMAAADRASNQPRKLAMRAAPPRSHGVSRGWQAIESSLEKLMPVCEDRIDAWNRGPEPG